MRGPVLLFWEGGGRIFLLFSLSPLCSLYVPMRFQKGSPSSQTVPSSTSLLRGGFVFHFSLVPYMFLLSSQWVLIRFSVGSPSSQCVPQHCLHTTSLLSHMLWQLLSSFQPIQMGKMGGILYLKKGPSILGSP